MSDIEHRDRTTGGDLHDEDGNWTGWKLRGQSEAWVIERIQQRRELAEFYGPLAECDGMGI